MLTNTLIEGLNIKYGVRHWKAEKIGKIYQYTASILLIFTDTFFKAIFFVGECYHYDLYYYFVERLRQRQSVTESQS